MRTLARVSGSRSPTSPPPTNTDDASRMGMALVMPTREPKIRLPSTAASLHMALQKPNPVPLKTQEKRVRSVFSARHQLLNNLRQKTSLLCFLLQHLGKCQLKVLHILLSRAEINKVIKLCKIVFVLFCFSTQNGDFRTKN